LAWQRQIREALAPHELTHVQFVLLASLWWLGHNCSQPPRQSQLAEHAGIDPMMTSQVIRKLAGRGLLDRHPDPTDSRARQLTLTPLGAAVLTGALADVEMTDENYFAVLGSRRDALLADLATLDSAHSAREAVNDAVVTRTARPGRWR